MTESPLREMLLRSLSSGMLASAISTGVVTYCSTSCAPSEGAWVITCTCLSVISGVESKGRWMSETMPQMTRAIVKTPTTSLWRME